jgi:hypothetical protein
MIAPSTCHVVVLSLNLFLSPTGILDPDPWKRWTAHQASHHPFITGGPFEQRRDSTLNAEDLKEENQANLICDIYWEPPLDPGICRRKLLNVQKTREKQQAMRRGLNSRSHGMSSNRSQSGVSVDGSVGNTSGGGRYVEKDSITHPFGDVARI